MMWGDGSVYEGEWMKGLPNGKGIKLYIFIQECSKLKEKNLNMDISRTMYSLKRQNHQLLSKVIKTQIKIIKVCKNQSYI